MSTIESTVREALTAAGYSQYTQYAEGAIRSLTEREGEIAQGIIDAAVTQGMQASDVRDLLADLGMYVPVSTPFDGPVLVSDADPAEHLIGLNETLANIQRTLAAIMQAASENGITIRV